MEPNGQSPLRKDDVGEPGEKSLGFSMSPTEQLQMLGQMFNWIPRPGKLSWHCFLVVKLMVLAIVWGIGAHAIVEIFDWAWHLGNW